MSHPARNPSFLDVVAQYSSFPQPDPSRRDQIAASENADEEDLEKLLDNTDPAHSHLDPEYSYSFIHLSLEECRALVQRFRSADPENNGLTQEQFSKVAGSFLASKTTSEPAAIFAMFDTTSSSRVTLREFLCGYAILCKGTTDTRIRYIFNMFDVDDEGVLRRDQLLRALKLIEAYARSAEVASKPQNNALESSVSSPTLVPGAAFDSESEDCDPDNLVDAIVDSLLAGEEQISYEEFISMCKQEENVMLWLEKLAEGTGEFIEESVRAASERHVVELNMQRAGVIGSPPQVVRGVPAGYLARRDERQRSSSRAILADGSVSFLTIDPADIDANPEALTDRKLFASANVSTPVLVRRSKSSAETGDAVKQPFIIDFEQIKFGNIIGRGACATVYAGEWLHMPVAVKIFNEDNETRGNADVDSAHGAIIDRKLVGDLIEEASVLMQVRHPSVCLFLCLCIEPKVCIVSELYLGGSVHDYLHGANPRSFAPNKARELISHVAQGLTYLHSSVPVILHQDLKTRNILLDRAVTHCVICDFGVSRLQDKSQTAGHRSSRGGMVGSVNTMAPEVMEGREYTRASDVYSFAMVAHEMFTGDMSFKGTRAIQVMFMVTEGERPQIDETVVPPALTKLLERCWAADPASRPDFDSIMTVLTSDALIDECDALEKRLHDAGERATSSITYMSRSLLDLAHAGDVDGVKRLILRDADVNYADYDRRTALHIACAEGQSRVVELLLESGSDFNLKDRWGGTPLTDARRNGHDGVVARLLVAGAALDLDVKVSNRVTSDDLLSSSILEGSAYGGGSELAGARIPQMRRHLELMLAVFAGNVDGCRALLARGYSVNASDYDGRTPCHLAVSEGNFEIVSLLLEFRCDTNLPDRWGSTALDEALRLGRTEILTLFEDAQASPK